jgi:HSP20 family molecular chaperone IbpA
MDTIEGTFGPDGKRGPRVESKVPIVVAIRGWRPKNDTEMTAPAVQHTRVPNLFDWVESAWPSLSAARSVFGTHLIRVEDTVKDDCYVIRAELPGINPDEDVKITVDDHTLVIDAERTEEDTDKTRTEFQYGSFHRAMSLPAGVKPSDVTATYTDGILTITIGITKAAPAHQIPIVRG